MNPVRSYAVNRITKNSKTLYIKKSLFIKINLRKSKDFLPLTG